MDDVADRFAAVRREIEEVSETVDAIARMARKKANNSDLAEIAEQVSGMQSDFRGKFETVHADLQATNNNVRRLVHAIEGLQTEIESRPVATASDQPRVQGPVVGWRLQLLLFFLAGIGLLALLQGAPQALLQMMPGLAKPPGVY